MLAFFNHSIVKALRRSQFGLALVIFYYAALAPTDGPGTYPPMLLHFVGNVLLITSCWLALWRQLSTPRLFILCVGLSIIAEGAQSFSATRVVDSLDIAANAAGLLTGLSLCWLFDRYVLGEFAEGTSKQNEFG